MTLFASRRAPAVAASVETATLLEVVRLDRTSWRISDSSIDASDPARIMGFIERLASDRFEVLLLVLPTGWAYVDTFGHALMAFSDRPRFEGQLEPQRDPDIEVPEPPLFHRIKRRSTSSHRKH